MLRERARKLLETDVCIIVGRISNMSTTEIAKDLGVSRERVRQIKNRVNDKLNRSIVFRNTRRQCKRQDCEAWFVPKLSRQQFCSTECGIVYHRRKKRWTKLEGTFIKLVSNIRQATPPLEVKREIEQANVAKKNEKRKKK